MPRSTLPLLLLLACGDEPADDTGTGDPTVDLACVVDHPITDPAADFASDLDADAAQISAECEAAGGEGCAVADWRVGRTAALCLAEENGFAAELYAATAALDFDPTLGTPTWVVAWTWETDDMMEHGVELWIDLVSGEVLDEESWSKDIEDPGC